MNIEIQLFNPNYPACDDDKLEYLSSYANLLDKEKMEKKNKKSDKPHTEKQATVYDVHKIIGKWPQGRKYFLFRKTQHSTTNTPLKFMAKSFSQTSKNLLTADHNQRTELN